MQIISIVLTIKAYIFLTNKMALNAIDVALLKISSK